MEQSGIIRGIYESVYHSVAELAKKTALFSFDSGSDCTVNVAVIDIVQCMSDKSGQMIIFDEKQYEQPACYEMCIEVSVKGKNTGIVLETFGILAVYFKDNPSVDISKWKWHGCQSDKVYLEPIIRHVNLDKCECAESASPLALIYKTEFSLNSQKAVEFKRVEKRDIRGYMKK